MTWIPTFSGRVLDFLQPDPGDIHIVDIACGLASACRFNGQIKGHYSVAEHSVWVSRMVSPDLALYGLLHDAAEAYMCDIVKPLKSLLSGYDEIERNVLSAIYRSFELPFPDATTQAAIKDADMGMLATEKNLLVTNVARLWDALAGYRPYPIKLLCLERDSAFKLFMDRFNELSLLAEAG